MTTPDLPDDVREALEQDPVSAEAFAALPPSHQQEYLTWIAKAAQPETRLRRISKMLQMIHE